MPDVRINYAAFAISILTNCLPEWAFDKVYGKYVEQIRLEKLSNTDLNVIKNLRIEGHTYQQIGDLYGVSKDTIYNILRRSEGKI